MALYRQKHKNAPLTRPNRGALLNFALGFRVLLDVQRSSVIRPVNGKTYCRMSMLKTTKNYEKISCLNLQFYIIESRVMSKFKPMFSWPSCLDQERAFVDCNQSPSF